MLTLPQTSHSPLSAPSSALWARSVTSPSPATRDHCCLAQRVTGPNTVRVASKHSRYSSVFSSMRGVLFGTLNTFYFQLNTSPYISHDTDTTMTHYDTGLKFLSTIRCSSFGEPFSHRRLSNRRYPHFGAIIATYDFILNYTTKCTIITELSPP
jgi:hypothetical protein